MIPDDPRLEELLFHARLDSAPAPARHRLMGQVVFDFPAIVGEAGRHGQTAYLRSIDVDKAGRVWIVYSVGPEE